jgi:chromosome segregation ATPase
MTTKQKLVRLKELSRQAGANIFERCKLASEVLQDTDWLAQCGDEFKARDLLQAEYFRDLSGFISIGRLVELYEKFPLESKWKEYKYDLAAMDSLEREMSATENDGLKGVRTAWKPLAEKFEREVTDLRQDLQSAHQKARIANGEVEKLRGEIRELERENATLRGRITQLERMLKLEPEAA